MFDTFRSNRDGASKPPQHFAPSRVNPSGTTVLLVALLAAALAGCGGGGGTTVGQSTGTATTITREPSTTHKTTSLGKAAYERTMRRLGVTLAVGIEGVFPLAEGKPGSAAEEASVAKLEKARATVMRVRLALGTITAPRRVQAEHQRLFNSLGGLRDEMDTLILVLRHGGAKPFGTYTRFPVLQKIAQTVRDIERKGYAIGA